MLGSKRFTDSAQTLFAEASGDFNPMHIDAVSARRLLSGRQVVHGIHTLLSALDLYAHDLCAHDAGAAAVESQSVQSVDCQFKNPVNLGDTAVYHHVEDGLGPCAIEVSVDGLLCTNISLMAGPAPAAAKRVPEPPARPALDTAAATAPPQRLAPLQTPLEVPPASQVGQRYTLAATDADALAREFPSAAQVWGSAKVAAIASLSQFVGMVCPGQHSVFSSAAFTFAQSASEGGELVFTVEKYDDRFRLFVVTFDGCLRGELRAFVRPPPQPQPSMREVSAEVGVGEFSGRRAWVIGGSRGLGETVAKICAAGGGEVVVTYAAGAADAQRVATEINAFAPGRCTVGRLDLGVDSFDTWQAAAGSFDAVYYFATPRIYRKKGALFDPTVFAEFAHFYLDRFAALCEWLEAGGERSRPVKVFLPSTVFIDERPKGMAEYAMVKAAAEVLADDLNRSLANVRIVRKRLPRLATDQTASIMKVATEPTLETLLGVVRSMGA